MQKGDYMDAIISAIIRIAGLFMGYMIPEISNKIIEYKKGKDNVITSKEKLYVNILLCIVNGIVWFYSFYNVNNIFYALLIAIQITLGLIVAYIDVKIRIIPNELVLSMIVLGIIFQIIYFGFKGLLGAIISMIVMMIVFTAVAGFVGFGKVGAGDVKLAGAMGLSLGYPLIITAIGIMAVALLGFILTGMALKKIFLSTMLPFAPFMIIGYIAALVSLII